MSIKLHRQVFGHGKPLVMLHGWAMHGGVWREFAQRLAAEYRVICLDLPGHGLSEVLEPFELQSIAEVVFQSIDEAKFILLGWSLGAAVALKMAALEPDRINKLILLAGNPKFVQTPDWPGMPVDTLDGFADLLAAGVQPTLARFLALQVHGLAHGKGLLRQLSDKLGEFPPPSESVLRSGLQLLKTADLRSDLLGLSPKLAVVLGECDRLVPIELADKLMQVRPDIRLSVMPGAGHAAFLSHSHQLVEIVRGFINDGEVAG